MGFFGDVVGVMPGCKGGTAGGRLSSLLQVALCLRVALCGLFGGSRAGWVTFHGVKEHVY